MRHLDLFSGIGGFSIASEKVWCEVEHIFCDNEPFSQALLQERWPKAKIYGDIRQLTADTDCNGRSGRCTKINSADGGEQAQRLSERRCEHAIDLLTGGFPCQPFSQAGRRRGTADNRYLWPEMFRVIREFQPTWVIAENVRGLVTWNEGMVLEQVCTDLESEDYEVQPFIIPACAVNAPHRRDRVWIIAHTRREHGKSGRDEEMGSRASKRSARKLDSERRNTDASNSSKLKRDVSTNDSGKKQGQFGREDWDTNWSTLATALCRVDDGLPKRLDRTSRLKALGNAIVPQVAEEIISCMKI